MGLESWFKKKGSGNESMKGVSGKDAEIRSSQREESMARRGKIFDIATKLAQAKQRE